MAKTYYPRPTDGGDLNIWGPKQQRQTQIAIGLNTAKVYLDGGILYLSDGQIGLNYSSSGYGIIINDAAASISIAALTASLWGSMASSEVAGTVVTEITSILGANDPAMLPTWTYDPGKGGHYSTPTKRDIARVWINAAGAVEGIVNEIGGVDGYTGYATSDDAIDRIFVHHRINYNFAQADIDVEYVMSKSAAYTILDYFQHKGGDRSKIIRIVATAGANGWRMTLPTVASNAGRIVKVNRIDAGAGCVTIVPNGGTISGASYVFLFEANDYVELYCDGANWYLIHASLTLQTGGINSNDWTNRELGDAAIPYDGAAGTALVVGEKITEATSGNTGIIVAKTATVLTLKKVTGTGIFTNDRTLTGSFASGTVEVNIPGSTSKNADSNFYHGFGVEMWRFILKLCLSANATYNGTNSTEAKGWMWNGGTRTGWSPIQVDTNNVKLQTASGGIDVLADDSTDLLWDTEDYSYNSVMHVEF